MSLSYVTHNNQEVLYIDFTQCKTKELMLQQLEEVKKEFIKLNRAVLTLNNFTGTYMSHEFLNKAKEYGRIYFDNKTKKSAILGVQGIKKILLKTYNMVISNKQVPFDTEVDALNYLTQK